MQLTRSSNAVAVPKQARSVFRVANVRPSKRSVMAAAVPGAEGPQSSAALSRAPFAAAG
jgi:hypothetical protein